MAYNALYRRSIDDRDRFWAEQAQRIDWQRLFDRVCDHEEPAFARWFAGGLTNLCHNTVDRHVPHRPDQPALIHVSTAADTEQTLSFGQLFLEVQRMAAVLRGLGVGRGDRVLIYMPMIPEAIIAMLATVRLGAIHVVVFGGLDSACLAIRIDDARPMLVVTADAGWHSGQLTAYKPLLDAALAACQHQVAQVLFVDRELVPATLHPPRDLAYRKARSEVMNAAVPCEWVEASHPSHILYTNSRSTKPPGMQRDTGGYAVALATAMDQIYDGQPGETVLCTSDIGWVVGHGCIVYGPLLRGMTTVIHEGDATAWCALVEQHKVNVMLSPTATMSALQWQDPDSLGRHDLSTLKHLFLAGEPLDDATAQWLAEAIGRPVANTYWQNETGWPILGIARGVEPDAQGMRGASGIPMPGYKVRLLDDLSGEELRGVNQKGVLTIEPPLPPGCLQTIWGDDLRFVQTYWRSFPGKQVYNTFDWALQDEGGHFFILGPTDDVISAAPIPGKIRNMKMPP